MTLNERTGKRGIGFSLMNRYLVQPGSPLHNVSRHIDIDMMHYCNACKYPFALVESKFRMESPPPPVAAAEWAMTRLLADRLETAAIALAWTNPEKDDDLPGDEMNIQLHMGGRLRPVLDHNYERVLVKLLTTHKETACPFA